MPVVGRRNGYGIDVFVFEDTAEISLGPRIASPLAPGVRHRGAEMALVDVHDVGDADVLDAGQVLVMIESAAALGPGRMTRVEAAQPDDRDVYRIVRALPCVRSRGKHSQSGSRGCSLRQERAAIHWAIPPS